MIVNVVNDANWQKDLIEICSHGGQWNACKMASLHYGEPVSVKNMEHMEQISITKRFQEYLQNFDTSEGDELKTSLISPGLDSLNKVPI